MKVVVVSGTPCVGKTEFCKKSISQLGGEYYDFAYIDVNNFIKENNLSEGYDEERDCLIVDEDKLEQALTKKIKKLKETGEKGVLIDSHMAHILPNELVDECVILKCSIKELKTRLEKRGYSPKKVRENLDSEIFDICFMEAKEKGHNVRVVHTDSDGDMNATSKD